MSTTWAAWAVAPDPVHGAPKRAQTRMHTLRGGIHRRFAREPVQNIFKFDRGQSDDVLGLVSKSWVPVD